MLRRNKGVFFVKRETEPLPDDSKELLNHMTCGDIHPNSLEHFCALVEEVMVPILKNEANMAKFPQCISDGENTFGINQLTSLFVISDIKKQVHELATSVYQIRGHIKGKTLLPFPQGASQIDEEERKARASSGKECDIQLKNAIEGIIIKWAYQVDEVLSKDSAEEIADDKHPGPMTEINFWEAKCINLESLFEQVFD